MPDKPDKEKDEQAAFSRIVNNLLKKLPHADPELKGDRGVVHVSGVPDVQHAPRGPEPPSTRARLAVWGRVALGLLLGGVVNQWPYGQDCGLFLYLYMGALLAVVVAGIWAAVSSWHRRMGFAHIVAVLLAAWGAALIADTILPRIGYAAVHATWRCL
ncbi:MAG: hypothetical protein EXR93_06845 [Gemmatimonadetes bacterium]|nr:hypothetical protein [Gemmatimonadota bacterium]